MSLPLTELVEIKSHYKKSNTWELCLNGFNEPMLITRDWIKQNYPHLKHDDQTIIINEMMIGTSELLKCET